MKHALTTGISALSPKQRKAIGATTYAPRERAENEALPTQVNKMAGHYTPPTWHVRDRSMDHQAIKSRGF